jgi:hypothetical protein
MRGTISAEKHVVGSLGAGWFMTGSAFVAHRRSQRLEKIWRQPVAQPPARICNNMAQHDRTVKK